MTEEEVLDYIIASIREVLTWNNCFYYQTDHVIYLRCTSNIYSWVSFKNSYSWSVTTFKCDKFQELKLFKQYKKLNSL